MGIQLRVTIKMKIFFLFLATVIVFAASAALDKRSGCASPCPEGYWCKSGVCKRFKIFLGKRTSGCGSPCPYGKICSGGKCITFRGDLGKRDFPEKRGSCTNSSQCKYPKQCVRG